mmetsp:Transcript_23824/g.59061  ORF Transcript_23824/g.59061 Transcript_23824/m.59061 type:complete len:216 (-) Transcript_23824:956-1603(-)
MGDRESPPYTAPMWSGPKISEHADGRNAQCAPKASPTSATDAKTPSGLGNAARMPIPAATVSCATARNAGRGSPRYTPRSEAAPPPSRPRQLHTEKSDTSAEAVEGGAPAAVATASMLFTRVMAAPDDTEIEAKSSQNSTDRSDASSVSDATVWPFSGGGPRWEEMAGRCTRECTTGKLPEVEEKDREGSEGAWSPQPGLASFPSVSTPLSSSRT